MSEYTPLTPQEIYERDIAIAGEEGLTPTTRIEWFLNEIIKAVNGGGGGGSSTAIVGSAIVGTSTVG